MRCATRASTPTRPGSFERHVQAALDSLPPDIARLLETVAVVIEDLPTPFREAIVLRCVDKTRLGGGV